MHKLCWYFTCYSLVNRDSNAPATTDAADKLQRLNSRSPLFYATNEVTSYQVSILFNTCRLPNTDPIVVLYKLGIIRGINTALT